MQLHSHIAGLATVALLTACAPATLPHPGTEAPLRQAEESPVADPSGGLTLATLQGLGLETRHGAVSTYYSRGFDERARTLQRMVEEGQGFFADSLGLRAEVNLAVLAEEDWTRITPTPYTVPFYSPGAKVIVLPATTAGIIVDDYLAARPRLPADRLRRIEAAGFSFEDGAHAMVDLIGYHELGHLYTRAYGIRPPGHWLNEFVATYFAYSFLRRARPNLAELWDGIVQPSPDARPAHTSLTDFDRLYFGVGPENYFWYQGTFAAKVSEVFDQHGLGFLRALREAFPADQPERLTGDEVLVRLERLHPGFGAWAARLER